MKRSELEQIKMQDLRKLYPSIKETSKAKFIDRIPTLIEEITRIPLTKIPYSEEEKKDTKVDGEVDILEQEADERTKLIKEHFSPAIHVEMGKITGCDCVVENYEMFMSGSVSKIRYDLQKAINKEYTRLFKRKAKYTKCPPCLKTRIYKIKQEYFKLIEK